MTKSSTYTTTIKVLLMDEIASVIHSTFLKFWEAIPRTMGEVSKVCSLRFSLFLRKKRKYLTIKTLKQNKLKSTLNI